MSISKGIIHAENYQVNSGYQFVTLNYKNDLLLTANNTFWYDEGNPVYPLKKFLGRHDTTYTWTDHDHSKELRYYLALFKKLTVVCTISEEKYTVHTVQELVYALAYYLDVIVALKEHKWGDY